MLTIDYYSDVLCVWAWIAQRRIDELNTQFDDQIEWKFHYTDIFGNTGAKIQGQWLDRGLYDGFSKHVVKSAAGFENAPVNPKIWSKVRPTTSANAHLFLKAVELACGTTASISSAFALRQAFFVEAKDISDLSVLCGLLKTLGLDDKPVSQAVNDGTAIAALMSDYQQAKQLGIKGSPSYVLDSGRQTLYGNVGYRVLHANIEELLKTPADEASWC